MESHVADGAHSADRHRVAHDKDCRGTKACLPGLLERGHAAFDARGADDDPFVADDDPDRLEPVPISAKASAGDTVRVQRLGRCGWLHANDQHLAMAKPDDVVRRGSGATDVVDLDRVVVRQGRRVDEDDRQARPADLLDLGMVVAQPDGNDAVHRCPAERAGQRPVHRGDEMEGVAVLLGHEGHALTEGPEERVREDDAQRLRGQETDRLRLALGEHPGDGVGPVAEPVGDLADPDAPSRARAGRGC